jgi:hypothetical protein
MRTVPERWLPGTPTAGGTNAHVHGDTLLAAAKGSLKVQACDLIGTDG